ncbi:MAG: hypothetical protein Q8L14_19075 [Myxococcales bacterium]|nr:hypothetical protein [Myxococcales bacterium]
MFGWLTKWLRRSPVTARSSVQVEGPREDLGAVVRELVELNSLARERAGVAAVVEPMEGTPGPTVRLERVLDRLRKTQGVLSVEDVASLGLMLIESLKRPRDQLFAGAAPRHLLLTRAGSIVVLGKNEPAGRFTWLCPESIVAAPLTERSEVHGVCSLLFAAAALQPPYAADSDLAMLVAIREGRLVGRLEVLRPDLPVAFTELLHVGLSVGPWNRFENLSALRAVFESHAGDVEVTREALLQRAFALAPPTVVSTPPASGDAAIVEAIAKGDESARLVYADLLEERGLGHQARWLRLESQVQTLTGPARGDALKALRPLRELAGREFLATVARPALEGCPVRFGFRCPMTWAGLTPTSDPVVRHCSGCDSPVTFYDSLELAQRASAEGKCVAIDLSVERHEGDLDPQQNAIVGMIG